MAHPSQLPQLPHLPQNLILLIAEKLNFRDTNALARTCSTLYELLNRYLYHRSTKFRGQRSAVLLWACKNIQPQTARHALRAGADINAFDTSYSPASAALTRALEWIGPASKALVNRTSWKSIPEAEKERIMEDLKVRWHLLLTVLLSHGANTNTRGTDGLRPLHKTIALPNAVNIIKGLVTHGASVNDPGDDITPLQMAAWAGKIDIMEFLIKDGASIKTRRKQTGETALHAAARAGRVEAMKLLLEHGAEVDAGDFGKSTPLDYALKYATGLPKRPIIEFLAAKGADVLAVNISALKRVILDEYFMEAVECWTSCGSEISVEEDKILIDLEQWCERPHTIKCVLATTRSTATGDSN
ncbi:hypothetical protein ASPVEDRAFT_29253 [Aspergillus versicolor CBS 583.65]|uniref:Uncharacterized protein n=1 Tax=Aspergillus versicolor CBS 583.65 TaxID=1036611 RepID=A0A1L9PMC8_ASPVE|nr:uncharacterized protein ASPVEDRAFT_29253 [Aspergillus versicolor CBS 583.65]OJJ02694.1 hypothetical protein ASPVEDRAFT_29253 [Aspergillus versicolor CBS 583.65]